MKYLITGSHGFIGTALSRETQSDGFDIKQDPSKSISNYYALENYIEGLNPDVIIHLAALSGIQDCIDNPERSFSTNVRGTYNVLEAAKRHNIKRVVMASSGGVVSCPTPYHVHKRYLEDMAEAYHKTYGLSVCCLRFSNVYGIGSVDKTSVIANMFKEAIISGTITVDGDGSQTRDFVHISDVVQGIKKACKSIYSGYLNISGGNQHSIMSIALAIAKITGAQIRTGQPRANDAKSNIIDNGFAMDILAWEPRAVLEEKLIELYPYFKQSILREAV